MPDALPWLDDECWPFLLPICWSDAKLSRSTCCAYAANVERMAAGVAGGCLSGERRSSEFALVAEEADPRGVESSAAVAEADEAENSDGEANDSCGA